MLNQHAAFALIMNICADHLFCSLSPSVTVGALCRSSSFLNTLVLLWKGEGHKIVLSIANLWTGKGHRLL
jgi:hypothetical protein